MEHVDSFLKGLQDFSDRNDPSLRGDIRAKKDLDNDLKARMKKLMEAYTDSVIKKVQTNQEMSVA